MVLPALAINAASKPRLAASALHTALLSKGSPHLDELPGAFLWYIYICIHGQTIWFRVGPVNAQRANVRPAEKRSEVTR